MLAKKKQQQSHSDQRLRYFIGIIELDGSIIVGFKVTVWSSRTVVVSKMLNTVVGRGIGVSVEFC